MSLWCCTSGTQLPAAHTSRNLSWDACPPFAHMVLELRDWVNLPSPKISWLCSWRWMIWSEGLKESQKLTASLPVSLYSFTFSFTSVCGMKAKKKLYQDQHQINTISVSESVSDMYQTYFRITTKSKSDQYQDWSPYWIFKLDHIFSIRGLISFIRSSGWHSGQEQSGSQTTLLMPSSSTAISPRSFPPVWFSWRRLTFQSAKMKHLHWIP